MDNLFLNLKKKNFYAELELKKSTVFGLSKLKKKSVKTNAFVGFYIRNILILCAAKPSNNIQFVCNEKKHSWSNIEQD